MRPKQLTLCGWGPYRNQVEIDFTPYESKGIFLITGATGAGKTTIFDAITYALYGALSGEVRDKERGSVRSDFADGETPTFVELTMEHAGKSYRIRRNPEYMRRKKRSRSEGAMTKEKENAVLYLPDDTVVEGSREVNARLQELLGLDHSQFKQISMIAQGEFARLLTASPKDKTRIFREIFGTGVYERFTAALGVRSRALYGRYMEQKHKLEEDVRLLTVGLEHSGFSQERKDELTGLVSSENWNYGKIAECISTMEKEARELSGKAEKEYRAADRQSERLAERLTRQQEKQKQLERFLKAKEEKQKLQEQSKSFEEKEKKLQAAQNAGWVESSRERAAQARLQTVKNQEEAGRLLGETEALRKERESLLPVAEKQEEIALLLDKSVRLMEKRKEQARILGLLEEKEKLLDRGQKRFLEAEAESRIKKLRYEEADRKRKLEAIGIAAGLLEKGKPCPVCGSTAHPAPAALSEDVVTEEELKGLKRELEKQQSTVSKLHEEAVTARTQAEAFRQQALSLGKETEALEGELVAVDLEAALPYLAMEPGPGRAALRQVCDRAQQLKGLMEEKGKRLARLKEEAVTLTAGCEAAEAAFVSALKQYGFRDTARYEAARLEAEERDALKRELEDYQRRTAANRELYEHLRAVLPRKKEELDALSEGLSGLETELEECRINRKAALEEQKRWERQLAEVRKTRRQFAEKREGMELESAEYGYVKDLENMASGNNARRLVFEQYVLAGYFEEILRAANLRFGKMTAGRYEMSRAEQVGDGRVKDNLEIRVMDYYTGKYRSVRTLSGGESFKASLALALGMSDVIQAMNGGIRVDTLFIDEGFGALDAESLDQACETLMGLVEKNRLIGIISHVPELRERIDSQLVVDKTGCGSRVGICV